MSTAGDEAQSVEMELEERTDETEGQIDGDDSNPLEDEYCRAHWNSKSFPTDRGDIIRELKVAKKVFPALQCIGSSKLLAAYIVKLRAGTYRNGEVVEVPPEPLKQKQFQLTDHHSIRLIQQLLLDGAYVEANVRLRGGDSGGADGTLNDRVRTTTEAGAKKVGAKETAWIIMGRAFIDPEKQRYTNFAEEHRATLEKPPCSFDLSAVLALDPNLSQGDIAVLSQLSEIKLAEKLRLHWTHIKAWYTKPCDKWGASGQMDPSRDIKDFMGDGADSTPHPAVVEYLHLIVRDKPDQIDFSTKTLSFSVRKDAAPNGVDPITGETTGSPQDAAARVRASLGERRNSTAGGTPAVTNLVLDYFIKTSNSNKYYIICTSAGAKNSKRMLEENILDGLKTLAQPSACDQTIADGIASIAKSARMDAMMNMAANKDQLSASQQEAFKVKMDAMIDGL